MRIHCKVVAIAVCFGVFLLLYFLGGNAADDPLLKEVAEEEEEEDHNNSVPSPSQPGRDVASKFARKSPDRLRVRAQEPPKGRKEGKAINRGASVNAKSKPRSDAGRPVAKRGRPEEVMHLAVVACGNRLDETLTMVKSALLFSVKKIKFHIFAEDPLASQFEKGFHLQLNQWPRSVVAKFQYSIYPITFSVGNAEEWKKLFKPCAAQRLFLPVILKEVDSLLYVDTDVLFLRPMDDIWAFLKAFNKTQLAAMAPEHEVPKIGWYSRFARHPFYGVTGVNSGVMLMNLTRIRKTLFKNSMIPSGLSWEDLLHPLYQKYKNHITWGDQDLLNIIFHYNPECLFTFPCQWNYRPDHCMYGSNCKGAEEEGVSILHGNRGVYHDDKQPAFKVVYDAIHDFPLQDNLFQSLFYPIQTKFLDTVNTLCGRIPQVFLKQIEKTMRNVYEAKVVRHAKPHK
uniref:glucoside xylosyltransferase 2 isoform X1 n=1 Tax=Centroberyx gerrardi TaxID=166262 RepID=UPI003AAD50A3